MFGFDLSFVYFCETLDCCKVGKWKDGSWLNKAGIVAGGVFECLKVLDDHFSVCGGCLKVLDCTLDCSDNLAKFQLVGGV